MLIAIHAEPYRAETSPDLGTHLSDLLCISWLSDRKERGGRARGDLDRRAAGATSLNNKTYKPKKCGAVNVVNFVMVT